MRNSSSRFWRWIGLALLVIVLDQLSKDWVLATAAPLMAKPLTSFFNLVLIMNPGAAFSFLADAGGWQKWLFLVLALGISAALLRLLRLHAHDGLLSVGVALVLGGALGNAIDRLRFDAVIDFLDFHMLGYHWPAFNVADSAITLGVFLMLAHQLRPPKARSMENPEERRKDSPDESLEKPQ